MPSPYNITNIPAPRVDFIDPRTGLMAREWYRFFFNLFNLTGAGTTDTSLADLQVGPPAINEVLGELGITYDQAQIASMMAQYEQSVRNIQNQLDTAPAAPQLGTLAAVNADNVRLLGFSTNPSPSVPNPAPTGTLYWDGNSTLGLQMNQGVLAKLGQSQFTYVKASSAITKGQLVKHTGAVGGSGVITVAPTSIGMTDANQIVGVAAEDIALNAFGFIQDSGDLRGFNTTGASVGEVWADGDPLYYNPAYVGGLTKIKPSAPNLKSYIGEVINAGTGGSGSIHVRMSPGSVLGGTDSNVQFGTLADKDLIQYDSVAQYWKNVAPSSISIGTATNLAGGSAGSVPYQTSAGATTFLPIGTASQVLKVNAGATAPEWVSGAALSKVDDTNVTLTLGGSPTTSLLAATSLTLGWTGTLAVSRGGTGTGTAFTAGSVIFAGASGIYSQDNANLFWDAANNRLGIGTATPGSTLDVAGSLNVTGNVVLGDATTDTVNVAGYMGVGGSVADSRAGINCQTSSLTGGSQRGIRSEITGTSAATVRISAFNALTGTQAAVFTVADVVGYAAFDSTKGAGSTITNQHGVLVYDQTQGTNNFGVTSQITSGANKWNIYASGTANNAFAGNVRIGSTTAPTVALDVTGAAAVSTSITSPIVIGGTGTTSTLSLRSTSGVGTTGADIIFQTGNNGATEVMRMLNSAKVLIGATSARTSYTVIPPFQTEALTAGTSGASFTLNSANSEGANVFFTKTRGTSAGSNTTVVTGDTIGNLYWAAADGTDTASVVARISATVEGTVGTAVTPGVLRFATTGAGANFPSERMRIDSSGNVGIGTTVPATKLDVNGNTQVRGTGTLLVVGSGGLGYGSGSGGAVTQATSRTTGVTLNKTNGAITLVSAAGLATYQTFTVTNSTVAATDTIIVNQKSGTDKYIIMVTNVAAGSFAITFATTGGVTVEQPVFNFAVIKAVTA